MTITVKRNFGPLTAGSFLTFDDWSRIGELARNRIVRPTLQGLDSEGKPFTPLSDGYAKQLAKEGLSTVARLELSGQMLQSIQVVAHADYVELTF